MPDLKKTCLCPHLFLCVDHSIGAWACLFFLRISHCTIMTVACWYAILINHDRQSSLKVNPNWRQINSNWFKSSHITMWLGSQLQTIPSQPYFILIITSMADTTYIMISEIGNPWIWQGNPICNSSPIGESDDAWITLLPPKVAIHPCCMVP